MKPLPAIFLLLGTLLASVCSYAADATDIDIIFEGTVIAMPREQALQFSAKHNLSAVPADGLNTLLKLVRQKQADRLASLEVTTKNGMKGTSQSGTNTLIAEPVISQSEDAIHTNLELDCAGEKLTATFTANNHDVKFLGAFDVNGTKDNATCFAFVRLRTSSHPPTVTPPSKTLRYVDPALSKATEALTDIPRPWMVPKLMRIFIRESNAWMQRSRKIAAMSMDNPRREMWATSTAEDERIGHLALVLASSHDPRAAVTLGRTLNVTDFPFFGQVGVRDGLFFYFVGSPKYRLPPDSQGVGNTFRTEGDMGPYMRATVERWWAANRGKLETDAAKKLVPTR